VDDRPIDDIPTLFQLRRDAKLTFVARGYFTVQAVVDSVPETILFPERRTILDFVSVMQNRI
jgi:hypothetical protein